MHLPEVNQRIGVRTQRNEVPLMSRVEDLRNGDEVLIALPSDGATSYPLVIDEEVSLEWPTERGIVRVDGKVLSREDIGIPVLVIEVDSSKTVQRRDYVRVDLELQVDLMVGAQEFNGTTVDVSGGGMRARFDGDLDLNASYDVYLMLPDEEKPVEGVAQIVRRIDETTTYAFRFVQMRPLVRERLIHYVFDAHRRSFANLRRTA
jgi:c-di-GMP-binding flagellar brake protein YcgR